MAEKFTRGERYVGCGDYDWYVVDKTTNNIIGRFYKRADAELDAQIPAMYKALRDLHKVFFTDFKVGYTTQQNKALNNAFAVLAKIEGD